MGCSIGFTSLRDLYIMALDRIAVGYFAVWPKCEPFVFPEGAREPTELGHLSDHSKGFYNYNINAGKLS